MAQSVLVKQNTKICFFVNAVATGFIVTDMTAKVPEKILNLMKETPRY